MDSMQADALRRVREMHSAPIPRENTNTQKAPPTPKPEGEHTSSPHQNREKTDSAPRETPLFADKEKLLILALVLILSGEENFDPSLALALLYLII